MEWFCVGIMLRRTLAVAEGVSFDLLSLGFGVDEQALIAKTPPAPSTLFISLLREVG